MLDRLRRFLRPQLAQADWALSESIRFLVFLKFQCPQPSDVRFRVDASTDGLSWSYEVNPRFMLGLFVFSSRRHDRQSSEMGHKYVHLQRADDLLTSRRSIAFRV